MKTWFYLFLGLFIPLLGTTAWTAPPQTSVTSPGQSYVGNTGAQPHNPGKRNGSGPIMILSGGTPVPGLNWKPALDGSGSQKLTTQADALFQQKDYVHAAADYQKAITLWDGNSLAGYGLARSDAALGKLTEAIKAYRAVIYTDDPHRYGTVPGDGYQENNPDRLMEFVLVLDKARQYDEAVSVYNRAIGLFDYDMGKPNQDVLLPQIGEGPDQIPFSSSGLQAMAHVVIGMETPGFDGQELQKAAQLAPNSAEAQYYWGKYLWGRNDKTFDAVLRRAMALGDNRVAVAVNRILH